MANQQPVSLGPTRPWPLIQALFWTGEVLLALWTMAAGAVFLGEGEPLWLCLALLAGGALLFYLGLAMAGLSWITALARGPVVEMSAAGLRDIRVSHDVIPWEGLSWGLFYAGKGTTSIQFATPGPLRARWPMRMFVPLNRLLGTPPYFIMSLGTGKSAAELTVMLHGFREASS